MTTQKKRHFFKAYFLTVIGGCLSASLAGCSGFATGFMSDGNTTRVSGVSASIPAVEAPSSPSFDGPVLDGDGRCQGIGQQEANIIALGMNECDLVRLKGAPPSDVLIGQGGSGEREAQVMYSELGGRELYFFTNNKLTRIFKPGQG